MTNRELIGYVLAALILLFHVGVNTITMKLDWAAFGPRVQQDQQQIVQAINQLAQEVAQLKAAQQQGHTPTPGRP